MIAINELSYGFLRPLVICLSTALGLAAVAQTSFGGFRFVDGPHFDGNDNVVPTFSSDDSFAQLDVTINSGSFQTSASWTWWGTLESDTSQVLIMEGFATDYRPDAWFHLDGSFDSAMPPTFDLSYQIGDWVTENPSGAVPVAAGQRVDFQVGSLSFYSTLNETVRIESRVVPLGFPGDYNDDDTITQPDYVVWKEEYGHVVPFPGFGADGNADGIVNAADYTVWRDRLIPLSLPTSPFAIPEPDTLIILVASFALLSLRRNVATVTS